MRAREVRRCEPTRKDPEMSVRAALNIDHLLDAADEHWEVWTSGEPVLSRFGSCRDVATWRGEAEWREDREVLLALGRLTRLEGSRVDATAVLVHLLLPACEAVVATRSRNTEDARHVEDVAAGYLWAEVAEYPWDDPLRGWIPQGVARRVGRALDREFGWGQSAERVWRERAAVTPEVLERIARDQDRDSLKCSDVYWWALSEAGLSREDMDLLVALAVTATDDGIAARGSAGLTARAACLQVVEPGHTADQVQYRARKALGVLRAAARNGAAA